MPILHLQKFTQSTVPFILAVSFLTVSCSKTQTAVVEGAPAYQPNEEYPPWLLRDLLSVDQAAKHSVSIQQQDLLLAIIHGYGVNDWRDPQATQTFLLKNAVGADMVVKTGSDFAQEHSGKRLPRPQGDLIAENLRGVNGCLYYTSSSYQWYDPKTFKPHTDRGMVHARTSRIRN